MFRRAAKTIPAKAGQKAHIRKGQEGQSFRIHARELGGFHVATQSIDPATNRGRRCKEAISSNQHSDDDQNVRIASIASHNIGEIVDGKDDEKILQHKEGERLVQGPKLGAFLAVFPSCINQEDTQNDAQNDRQHMRTTNTEQVRNETRAQFLKTGRERANGLTIEQRHG